MPTHITEKNKVYPLDASCKSICKDCDGLFKAWEWYLDSLKEDYLVLRNDISFRYDTISNDEFKTRVRSAKKQYLEEIIVLNKKPSYVYKVPVETDYMKIAYSDMEMLTFSYKKKCYKGGPFMFLSNPNKIRRVSMQGATLKLKD